MGYAVSAMIAKAIFPSTCIYRKLLFDSCIGVVGEMIFCREGKKEIQFAAANCFDLFSALRSYRNDDDEVDFL